MIELYKEYVRTSYEAELGGETISLRIGEESPDVGVIQSNRWAFITACNPRSRKVSDRENADRMAELESVLSERGHKYYDGAGVPARDAWEPEPSFLVIGISDSEAAELGAKFDQNAIVFADSKGIPKLLDCRTPEGQLEDIVVGDAQLEQLLSALFARGLLLERDEVQVRFSDNVHGNDSDVLPWLLRRAGLGRTAEFMKDGPHDRELLVRILDSDLQHRGSVEDIAPGILTWRPHWTEVTEFRIKGDWGAFVTRRHGPKVGVGRLDAGIAAFVKGLNAAGAATRTSCAGRTYWTCKTRRHFRARPTITFPGPYFTWWARKVFKLLQIPGESEYHAEDSSQWLETNANYAWKDGELAVQPPERTQPHSWLVPIARLIYGNRRRLRSIRQDVTARIDETDEEVEQQLIRLEVALERTLNAKEFDLTTWEDRAEIDVHAWSRGQSELVQSD